MLKNLLFYCCSTIIFTQTYAQGIEWLNTFGGSGNEYAGSLQAADDGNFIYAGNFESTIDFDPGSGEYILDSGEHSDVFISKVDQDGNLIWAKHFGGTNSVYLGEFILTEDAIFICGVFFDQIDFDPGEGEYLVNSTTTSSSDFFLLKLSENGDFQWVKTWEHTGDSSRLQDLDIDSLGNIYLAGIYDGTFDADPGNEEVNYSNTYGKGILIKLDQDGNYIWSMSYGDASNLWYSYDVVTTCLIDSEDNVIVAGRFRGTFDFDFGTSEAIHTTDGGAFICKYDTDANLIWSRFIDGDVQVNTSEISPEGEFYFGGRFGGGPDFNTDEGSELIIQNTGGYYDIFILKLEANGEFSWAKGFGGDYNPADNCYALCTDMNGNIYVTGGVCASGDFDPGPGEELFNVEGFVDLYVSKFDANGNFDWTYTAGGETLFQSTVQGKGLYVDEFGKVFVFGEYAYDVDFGPLSAGTVNSIADNDFFFIKVDESITDLQELEDFDEITIYPNPTSSEIFLNSAVDIQTLDIIDLTGRLVSSVNLNGNKSISVAHLPEGHYILKIRSGNDQFISRLVVRR